MIGERTRVSGLVGRAIRYPESMLSLACQAWWKCNEGAGDTIGDSSPNGRHVTKGGSSVLAATVWASPGRASFPGTAQGWSRSGTGIYGPFSNVDGGLLIMGRINASTAPLNTDRLILGAGSQSGYESTHIRLRPVGTPFNTGDDGTVSFGLYPNGGSVSTLQVTSPVPTNERSICTGRDRHFAVVVNGRAKTMEFYYDGTLKQSYSQTAPQQASPMNTQPTFYLGTVNGAAGNTETIQLFDIQIYGDDAPPPSNLSAAIARVARTPFSFLTTNDWPT